MSKNFIFSIIISNCLEIITSLNHIFFIWKMRIICGSTVRGTEYIPWKTTAIIWKVYIVAEVAGNFLGIVSIGLWERRDRKVYTSALKLPVYSTAIRYKQFPFPPLSPAVESWQGACLARMGCAGHQARGQEPLTALPVLPLRTCSLMRTSLIHLPVIFPHCTSQAYDSSRSRIWQDVTFKARLSCSALLYIQMVFLFNQAATSDLWVYSDGKTWPGVDTMRPHFSIAYFLMYTY